MPRGPNGEYRPDDPVAAAIMVAKIATGEIEEVIDPPRERVVLWVSVSGDDRKLHQRQEHNSHGSK